ncbi:hypothetical protein F1B92_02225 [Campylobacter sp. FMV-PI01]|uniref:Uncharacterized protein n=1 Tax=Campylobacter portucalensis TaxID=2608384 RepID=A0A6L5WGD0_9BACT|nr:hypothetical protein [Campylobacter portucalensis]
MLSSVFQGLAPLIGLFFSYCVILRYEKEKSHQDYNHKWYYVIFFLFFAEQIHGFELFSVAIFFGFFWNFCFGYLFSWIKIKNLFLILLVFFGYLGIFLVSNLLCYIKNEDFLEFSYEYLIYIVIESFLAFIFLRGRIYGP